MKSVLRRFEGIGTTTTLVGIYRGSRSIPGFLNGDFLHSML